MAATRRHFFSRKLVWNIARIVRRRQPAGELTIMPRPLDPSRDLLFGLLALQTGLINQAQLVAAFHAWTQAGDRPMAEIMAEQGALDTPCLTLVEGLVMQHLRRHGSDPERSLAAIGVGRSTRDCLARIGNPELDASLAHAGSGSATDDSDPDRTPSYAVGTTTSDGQRFRVLRPHARGGLGAVFVALDTELHREVALKQILDAHADDPTSRHRFVLEAEITGGLEHPGIVPVYGLGSYGDGRPYYAMRFIRGDSLKKAIERFHSRHVGPVAPAATDSAAGADGRATSVSGGTAPSVSAGATGPTVSRDLELRKLLRRFTDVCNAIDYAHSRGVLHRDIKPGNVILGKYGETLVVDWGLAKAKGKSDPSSGERTLRPSSASGSAETLRGSVLGTPAYMSPEQAEGNLEALGPRSDAYSLGATLYSLLTGRPPFAGEPGEVLRAVQQGEFRPPRAIVPTLDRALEAVCLKAMALRPEDRYSSCRGLAEDLERWMADEPVAAWREPFSRRARRWMQRNRTAVAAAMVALVAVVIGLGAVAGVQAQANSALKKANDATTKALGETREAKNATEAALAQSEASRKQAKAINDFLTEDLLTQAEPAHNAPEDHVTLLEVLDRAAAKVGPRFADQPELESALRQTIASTYHGLASWEKAEAQRRSLLDAARRRDPRSAESYQALGELGHILRHRGRRDAAVMKMAETAAEGLEHTLGPDHPSTLDTLEHLALAYRDAGKLPEAIALYERVRDARIAKLGPDHPDTLVTLDNLAAAYWSAGKLPEAIALYERVRDGEVAKLGPDHPDTLQTLNDLAGAYRAAGKLPDAIALYERVRDARIAKLGPDHPDTLQTLNNLAAAYWSVNQLDKSVPLFEDVLRRIEAKLGRQHPDTQMTVGNLGVNYKDSGRLNQAIPLLEEAYHASDKFPRLRGVGAPLLDAYVKAGRSAAAAKLVPDIVADARRTSPKDSPKLAGILAQSGLTLLQVQAYAEAEPLLRECLAIREKTQPEDWSTFNTRSQLGNSLLGQGMFPEAELLIVAGYEGLKAREAKIPAPGKARLPEAAARVVKLYETWGKTDQAAAWKAKLGMPDLPADVFARP
jgi:serine/threonine protein kinase/tetratricopeptide (TPR) repeat protein